MDYAFNDIEIEIVDDKGFIFFDNEILPFESLMTNVNVINGVEINEYLSESEEKIEQLINTYNNYNLKNDNDFECKTFLNKTRYYTLKLNEYNTLMFSYFSEMDFSNMIWNRGTRLYLLKHNNDENYSLKNFAKNVIEISFNCDIEMLKDIINNDGLNSFIDKYSNLYVGNLVDFYLNDELNILYENFNNSKITMIKKIIDRYSKPVYENDNVQMFISNTCDYELNYRDDHIKPYVILKNKNITKEQYNSYINKFNLIIKEQNIFDIFNLNVNSNLYKIVYNDSECIILKGIFGKYKIYKLNDDIYVPHQDDELLNRYKILKVLGG